MSAGQIRRVSLREAAAEDDVAVGELLVAAFAAQYASKLPEVARTYPEARKRELRASAERRAEGTVLVAELDGCVVGTVTLLPAGARSARAWIPGAADLRALGVSPHLQGAGLAEPLMRAAEDLARAWGAPAVCLHMRRGVEGLARLYARRGYERAIVADLVLPDVTLHAYVLALGDR